MTSPQELWVLWGGDAAGLAPSTACLMDPGVVWVGRSWEAHLVPALLLWAGTPSSTPGCSTLALNTSRDHGGFIPAEGRLSLGGFVLSLVLSPGGQDDSDPLHPPKPGGCMESFLCCNLVQCYHDV